MLTEINNTHNLVGDKTDRLVDQVVIN